MSKATQKFNIIRQWGSPNEATTVWGWKALRQKQLFAPDPYNRFYSCLNYDNHFIYEIPAEYTIKSPELYGERISSFMCTCGAAAGLIGIDAYKDDANPEGLVFGCLLRNNYPNPETGEIMGKHADGST